MARLHAKELDSSLSPDLVFLHSLVQPVSVDPVEDSAQNKEVECRLLGPRLQPPEALITRIRCLGDTSSVYQTSATVRRCNPVDDESGQTLCFGDEVPSVNDTMWKRAE
jgi:hypothetical protein